MEMNTFTLPLPSKKDYQFKGCYTNSSFSGTPQSIITKGSTAKKNIMLSGKIYVLRECCYF